MFIGKQKRSHIEARLKTRHRTLVFKTMNAIPMNIRSVIMGHYKNGWGSWLIMKNIFVMNNGFKISRNKVERVIDIYENPENYNVTREEVDNLLGLNLKSADEIKKIIEK